MKILYCYAELFKTWKSKCMFKKETSRMYWVLYVNSETIKSPIIFVDKEDTNPIL